MYSPLNTHSKQLFLDDKNTSENHYSQLTKKLAAKKSLKMISTKSQRRTLLKCRWSKKKNQRR
jgi:hypothetical protein